DVQALKAGILEIADVLVVNKADLPGSTTMVNQLQAMLALRAQEARDVDVCKTTATTGEGIAELTKTIEDRLCAKDSRNFRSPLRMRRLLAAAAGGLLTRRLRDLDDEWLIAICESLQRGEADLESAAARVLRSGYLSNE
ncbi:MAG: methylmalonyl Co-A mutase-associated GTPase MeaB, partial [Gammaproteobacteria bacterium]